MRRLFLSLLLILTTAMSGFAATLTQVDPAPLAAIPQSYVIFQVMDNVTINATAVVFSKSWRVRGSIATSGWGLCTSATGTATLNVQSGATIDGTDTNVGLIGTINGTYNTELPIAFNVTNVQGMENVLKITGNATNPADTVCTFWIAHGITVTSKAQ